MDQPQNLPPDVLAELQNTHIKDCKALAIDLFSLEAEASITPQIQPAGQTK